MGMNFPLLDSDIVYLDSAATTQKPQCVIDAETAFYETMNANVHRGIYQLSELATESFEHARATVAGFIHALPSEIIFTRGTTESINLLAYSLGKTLSKGDEILISIMEHHSNFVPWQQLCKENHCKLVIVNLDKNGHIDMHDFEKKLSSKTKIVSLTHVSNVLGTINDIQTLIKMAHAKKALFIVDVAQSIGHREIDVKNWDADFVAFSGHKMYGPLGIGVLYGKKALLEKMPPFHFGGDMIKSVEIEKSTWNDVPWKFEAGTPNIAGAIALGKAVEFLESTGMEFVRKHENELMEYTLENLRKIQGLAILGPSIPAQRCSVVSFTLEGMHPHDLVTILDRDHIAVRGGHHCAMPLMQYLDISGSTRLSFGFYTTKKDIDKVIVGIEKAKKVFRL
jgi:cysteine desulfurase / selenocysteine lyase